MNIYFVAKCLAAIVFGVVLVFGIIATIAEWSGRSARRRQGVDLEYLIVVFLCLSVISSFAAPPAVTPDVPPASMTAQASQPTNPPAVAVPTNVVQLLGLPSSWGSVLSTFEGAFVDAEPYISNQVVTIEAGGLYNAAVTHGKFGGFLDVTVPTSQQTGVGIGGAYLGGHFLDANINMKLGTTTSLPLIGKVYSYISDGPDYDFLEKGIGNYAFAGVVKKFDIGPNTTLTVGGGIGNISTLPGTEKAFGFSLTKHF